MKKIIFVFLSLFIAFSSHALPLFPFFVDLTGNYKDGLVEELQPLEVSCLSSYRCNCFYSIEAADSYLDNVLPYENYPIIKKDLKKNGWKMKLYASPLEDDRTSIMCLVEVPGDGLFVIYDETPGDPFGIE